MVPNHLFSKEQDRAYNSAMHEITQLLLLAALGAIFVGIKQTVNTLEEINESMVEIKEKSLPRLVRTLGESQRNRMVLVEDYDIITAESTGDLIDSIRAVRTDRDCHPIGRNRCAPQQRHRYRRDSYVLCASSWP